MTLDSAHPPSTVSTLIELLASRAAEQPDRTLFTTLGDEGEAEGEIRRAELERRARRIGARLQELGATGARVMLLYPPGLDYLAGFFGCLYAGAVAVPAYPPDPSRLERTLPRLRAIVEDARATVVLTTSAILSMADFLFEQAQDLKALKWLSTDDLPEGAEAGWRRPDVVPGTLAFLQYTSGSTGTPKGVMLSHANLLHNLSLISSAFRIHPGSSGVIWLPPYHDMGLIGGILGTIYGGIQTTLMSPLSFLRRPLLWLEAVSRTRATISGGPNFAFDLCVRKISPDQRRALDLSRWELAFTGAEPVRQETLDRFVEAFAPCGFRREALYPCYGLAEGTLIVSGGTRARGPVVSTLDAGALARNRAVDVAPGTPGSQPHVGCGQTLKDQRIVIAAPETRQRCSPGTVGEIWVSGPSVARGYWMRPEESERAFQAQLAEGDPATFLRTGDLGFVREDGELFVTGRLKDLIIIRGRNHYPQDIELTVERSHPALRPGCGAAFSVDQGGEERLAVVQEIDPRGNPDPESVGAEIRRRVSELHEVQLHALALIAPGSLPKTSSGKVQRHASRSGFLADDLKVVWQWRSAAAEDAPEVPVPAGAVAVVGPEDHSVQGIEAWLRARLAARARVLAEQVALDEPITQHGLDSLSATELAHEVEQALGVSLSMSTLLEGPSVSRLAQRLFELRADARRQVPPLRPVPRAGELPLSSAQARLWFLDQLEPGNPFYNVAAAVRLEGRLDVPALEQSITHVVRRHEALRTTFASRDGKPVQIISPPAPFVIAKVDLRSLPAGEREAAALRQAGEEAQRPFDLSRGPLLRVTVWRLEEAVHVLLLTVHHIVSDGASMGVLVREVTALYPALVRGEPAPLGDLPLQYADYAQWQREWLRGGALDAQVTYWKERLAGAPPLLELPTDRPRPSAPTHRGAIARVTVAPRRVQALEEVGRQGGATLFMTLLAAFQTLLARWSGQEDILVGAPIAHRTRAETEGLIGFFVNTLVMRTDLSGDPTFQELLGRVREVALGAYARQDVPFEQLVEILQPRRSLSHTPLFQVVFALQEDPLPQLALPGLAVRALPVDTGTSKYDLVLSLARSAEGVSGTLEYSTELFEAETVRRLVEHWHVLLEGIAARPGERLSRLPLMTEEQRRRVLVEWNRTAVEYPRSACIHTLFEAQVDRTPEAVAVEELEGARLTYRELDERANRLANHLGAVGVKPGAMVGLAMERSLEMVVGILGVLKAGAAYVPLDPGYPRERLAFMMEDAGTRVLLTQERLERGLPASAERVLRLDTGWEEVSRASAARPRSNVTAEGLAYVMYTSGSTGRPKGVCVPHRAVVRLVMGANYVELGQDEVFLQLAPISFDASTLELWGSLLHGGRLVLHPPRAPSLEELGAALRRHGVTTLWLTSALFDQMVDAQAESLRGLKQLLAGGDVLSPARVRRVLSLEGGPRVVNGYGPTESTTFACCHVMRRPEEVGHSVSIGRPISNTRVYVLDKHLGPVPVGVWGELFIAGDGLAWGYLARPDLTAERFVPDPFSAEAGARLYRTGDVVRRLADGRLDFLGRVDHQVKVRGFRIELGEVQAVLEQHPRVKEAVVVARGAGGEKSLAAYVVASPGQAVDIGELRAYLKERLPEHMVPTAYVALDALPLSPTGKVDRSALPAPEARSEAEYVPPRTPVEELLAGAWAQVLGVPRVGVRDNFFELGGHSLLATQVISRIRALFQVELPLRRLFEAPTVAELAEHIERARHEAQALKAPPFQRAPRTGELPLSFAQQRLWFLDQLEPGEPFYNVPAALLLQGALDVGALERSFSEIARRHEVLRTTFPSNGGRPSQVISPPGPVPLAVVELRQKAGDEQMAEARRLAREEALRPFDLTRGPLLRTTLLRLGEARHLLLVVMHHIVSDGWSMGVLTRELAEAYRAFTSGRVPALPELPFQYGDFAQWQAQWLRGEVLDTQLAYWKKKLAGAPPALALPADRPRPTTPSFRGGREALVLPRELVSAVDAIGRREGATPYMTLLAAFQALLARYSGQDDIVVGSPIANRNRSEIEGLIGFFVNTLVLRTDLGGEPTFRALLARAREVALEAYAHQDIPFEQLVDALQPERSLNRTPLFQVMFVLQNAPLAPPALHGLRVELFDPGGEVTTPFDLILSAEDTPRGFTLTVDYSLDLYDAPTIRRMLGHFQRLLAGALAAPEQPLSTLPILTEDERRYLLREWNATSTGPRPPYRVHDLFEAQVERSPDADAVVFEDRKLTYRQLNERANQLARYLRRLGVRPEDRVVLLLEPSLELIVAPYAVLKAGGAYVPLDTTAPADRLAMMVENSRANVVLTQERLLERLPGVAARKVRLDADWPEIAREEAGNLDAVTTEQNLAYAIYTSGSTGEPKAVLVEHRSVVNHNLAIARKLELGPSDRMLQFTPINFDAAGEEIYPPLLSGACIIVRGELVPSKEFLELLVRERLTVLSLPPAYLHEALSDMTRSGARLPSTLRVVILGGEKISPETLELWQQRGGRDVPWYNVYGPTEATVTSAMCRIGGPGGEEQALKRLMLPMGRPIDNGRIYLLDARLQPVPMGHPGEVCIGGAGLARGYLGRPDMTAEKFLPDPFSPTAGARMYRTGDLARLLPTGDLEFLGRIDHQVKVRGFRVELGEIESTLRRYPGVQEAVVLAREDTPGDKRLVAYVVPSQQPGPTAAELRNAVREKLPHYMVPSAFIPLEALPLTPGGKVDRRALPVPDWSRPELAQSYTAPRNSLEEQLVGLWAAVLGVPRIGIHDHFFENGGHSLLATQLVSRIRDALNVELPVRSIFEAPTVAELAAQLVRLQAEQLPRTELERMLQEVEGLSSDEARTLLAEEGGPRKGDGGE